MPYPQPRAAALAALVLAALAPPSQAHDLDLLRRRRL